MANVGFSFGVAMAIRLVLGYYGGNWVDGKLGTEPWFAAAGVILAIGLSFHHLISEYSKAEQEMDSEGSGKEDE